MEVGQAIRIVMTDASGVGHARRVAVDIAERIGFDPDGVSRVALVVTEAASNLIKHAGGGDVLVQTLAHDDQRGIEVLTLDRGRGIADLAVAMRDGYSTSGTPGTGIGAIARQASRFDLYTRAGGGVVLLARLWRGDVPELPMRVGAINVCHPTEEISGDAWAIDTGRARTRLLVADGLGHGPLAADAARAARDVFRARPNDSPAQLLQYMHDALRPTRGAAVGLASIDAERGVLCFAGVGNIAGTIDDAGTTRSVVSHHGTLGHDARKFQEFNYPWPQGALFVMHSDGIDTRWRIDSWPGLGQRDPTLIAAWLYRDHKRPNDDATVVVLRGVS